MRYTYLAGKKSRTLQLKAGHRTLFSAARAGFAFALFSLALTCAHAPSCSTKRTPRQAAGSTFCNGQEQ